MSWISNKVVADTMMSIDCSTKSVAFGLWSKTKLVNHGEIFFEGKTVYDRVLDAVRKIKALHDKFDVDVIVIESAVKVRSTKVAIQLAYMFGAVIAALEHEGLHVEEVAPLTWQSHIGNPILTRDERLKLKKKWPRKSASFYSAKARDVRKNRTIKLVNKRYNVKIKSDNVADAIGVGWWAWDVAVEPTTRIRRG